MRSVPPEDDGDIRGLWPTRAVSHLDGHGPAVVLRVCPVVGELLAMRSGGRGSGQEPGPSPLRDLHRPGPRNVEDLSIVWHDRPPRHPTVQ